MPLTPYPPPIANPAFCVPAPADLHLDVIIAPPAVHDEPSYSWLQRVWNDIAAFCVPALAAFWNPGDIKAPPADQLLGAWYEYESSTLPVVARLPDMIAEPVYGNGSVSIAAPFCNKSPITLSDPVISAEPV